MDLKTRWKRPGITGSKSKRARDSDDGAEPVAETPPNAHPGVEVGEPKNRQQPDPRTATDNKSSVEAEDKTETRGGTKRQAEDEADDSERGDRRAGETMSSQHRPIRLQQPRAQRESRRTKQMTVKELTGEVQSNTLIRLHPSRRRMIQWLGVQVLPMLRTNVA